MLTNDEWDLLRDLIFILGPFEEATGILELKPDEPNENTMNINIENLEDVFVWNEDQDNPNNPNNEKNTNEHQKNVDLNQPMQISGVLKKVKDTLYQAMLFYWKNEREISYLLSILDPRIKKLDFAPYEIEQTLNSLKNKYRKMKLSMSSHLQSSPIPMPVTITTPFLGPTPSSTLYKSTLFDIFNHPSPANNRNELNEYLAIPQIPFNIDPFSWWKINKEKFPILSELARAYLSVSATSTPSERLFSDCGNLMGLKRTRISPEFFKRIMFLKRNYNILDTIYKPFLPKN
ncbi:zinc finger BED domain-containing protein 1-like [Rhizophagus irregularis DAOM 181602=DAOM 197198]|nr:zinc finger BED domain-containing protein 1-like [Rhizophagus irregularis DAOM 181602=DAOM 197198]